jgi:hypothetical protein
MNSPFYKGGVRGMINDPLKWNEMDYNRFTGGRKFKQKEKRMKKGL